jgi:hypothetical protein
MTPTTSERGEAKFPSLQFVRIDTVAASVRCARPAPSRGACGRRGEATSTTRSFRASSLVHAVHLLLSNNNNNNNNNNTCSVSEKKTKITLPLAS